nr:MAG TPA: Cytochrome c oxidase subunit IIa family [Caudoviricetes sp.]
MQEDRINQKIENKGMKNKVIGIHFIYFLVVSVVMGCTPMKRTASTEVKEKADYSEITNELKTQRAQLDKVTEAMSKTKEQIAEWLNENIDYEEQKYDSLGRLISTIKQTTSRNGGTTTVKQGDTYIYEGVTVQQVDSIVSAQMKQLRAELTAKSTEEEEPQPIGVFGSIMILVTLALLVFLIVFGIYNIWNLCDRPNLWRKFADWIKRLFCRR